MTRAVYFAAIMLFGIGFGSGYAVSRLAQTDPAIVLPDSSDQSNWDDSGTKENDIGKLRAELNEARRYIAYLNQSNNSLLLKIKEKNHSLLSSVASFDLLEKLDSVPEPILKYQLKQILGEDAVAEIKDVRLFSRRALEIALDSSGISAEATTANIIFSTSPVSGLRAFSGGVTVDRHDIIFAHIASSNSLGRLLVKWQNVNTGQILVFSDRIVANDSNGQYVSFRPTEGWQAGNYLVSIYQFNDELTPISSNSYSILAVNEGEYDGKGTNHKLIQEMLDSGQATYKQ